VAGKGESVPCIVGGVMGGLGVGKGNAVKQKDAEKSGEDCRKKNSPSICMSSRSRPGGGVSVTHWCFS